MTENMEEKKEEKKEAIKPILVVPSVDRAGHAVFKTITKEDAEILNTALDNPAGVLVKKAEDNVCPAEPDKPYKESVCAKLHKLFEKGKEKKRKKEREAE